MRLNLPPGVVPRTPRGSVPREGVPRDAEPPPPLGEPHPPLGRACAVRQAGRCVFYRRLLVGRDHCQGRLVC